MNTNLYDPTTALTAYYVDSSSRRPARLWSVEKVLQDWAAIGLLSYFEGPGPDPTALTGYGSEKIWLRQSAGVQSEPGDILAWNGTSPASDEDNWQPLTGLFTPTASLSFGSLTVTNLTVSNFTVDDASFGTFDSITVTNAVTAGSIATSSLSFNSTTSAGIRLNNLSTTQRDALASPSAGEMIWNTTLGQANVYDGSAWNGVGLLGAAQTWTKQNTFAAGSLTTSQPFTISQTWNAGGVTFTGISASIVKLAAASASNYLDFLLDINDSFGAKSKFKISGKGYLGVFTGTQAPLARLQVGDGSSTSVDPQILINRTVLNTGDVGVSNDMIGINAHGFVDSSTINRSGTVAYASYDARVNFHVGSFAQSYDHYAAFQSAATNNCAQTITNWYGFGDFSTFNFGTTTNKYGGYVAEFVGTGTVTNNYGYYVEALTKGATLNYAYYSAGTTPSSFGGPVTVAAGVATPANGSTSARLLFGTTAGFGIYYGSGAPTVSAGKGSWYLRSDGSGTTNRAYVNTDGSTTWTAVTTAA